MRKQSFIGSKATLILLCICLSTSMVHAQVIYKKVNADGTVTFSDKPFDGAKEVDMSQNKGSVVPSNNPTPSTKPLKAQVTKKIPVLSILSPAHEATIRNNTGNVTISATIEPKLSGKFLLRVRDRTLASSTGQFVLSDLERGTYPYQINFVDNKGKVIASSATQRFYLHKNTVISRPLVQGKP